MADDTSRRSVLSRRSAIKAGATALGAGALSSAVAAAERIDGPTTIDEPGEYRLSGDVDGADVDGECISIEADDVTVDGGGHAIRGGGDGGTGVFVAGVENVTVRNVTVSGWAEGVAVSGSATVESATISDNGTGIQTEGNADVTVEGGAIRDNDDLGIDAQASAGSALTVDGTRVAANGGGGIRHLHDAGPYEFRVSGAEIAGNDGAAIAGGIFDPLVVEGATIEDNAGDNWVGVASGRVVDTTIRANDGIGLGVWGDAVEVRDCTVEGNVDGLRFDVDYGGTLVDATVEHTNVVGNQEHGLLVEYDGDDQSVDATCNWWGAESGPDHADDGGDGDAVGGAVVYDPWATERIDGEAPACGDDTSGSRDGAVALEDTTTVRRELEALSVDYDLSVAEGIVEGSDHDGEGAPDGDVSTTVSGTVGADNDEDWFWFDGDAEALDVSLDGPATVFVNGEEIDVGSVVVADTVTVRADDGASVDYDLSVAEGIVEGSVLVGEEKELSGTLPTSVDGTVASGDHWFWFDGDAEALEVSLDGPGTALVNGDPIDDDAESGTVTLEDTVTVRRERDDEAVDYDVSVAAGVVDGADNESGEYPADEVPTSASGTVGPDNYQDWFWFDGDADALDVSLDGPATVFVNGEAVDG